MRSIFGSIAKLSNRLFGADTMLPHEKMVLDAWRGSLAPETQRVLDAQIAEVSTMQRQAAGAKLCFYYDQKKQPPLFHDVRSDLHVASVLLQSSGTETMRAKIFVHRGRFFSIEFPKRPDRYFQQHHMRPDALQVAGVETHLVLA